MRRRAHLLPGPRLRCGDQEWVNTEYCCENGLYEFHERVCVNESWQYTGEIVCFGQCGGGGGF